jgi:hypothetical protein
MTHTEMLLHIHENALMALTDANEQSNLAPRIVQTLGDAKDSGGFHLRDGSYLNGLVKRNVDYCAAIDFSVIQKARRISDQAGITMDAGHIKWFLHILSLNGFVAWYRRKSQGFAGEHIHAIYVGVPMKPQLQRQVKDYLAGLDGLAHHRQETFWRADDTADAALRVLFEKHN